MKKKASKTLLIVIILLVGVIQASCSKKNQASKNDRIQISFWLSSGGVEGEILQGIVSQFNDSQTKYKVTAQVVTDYYKKVDMTIANNMNGMPDVMIVHSDKLATYASRNVISPITTLGESDILQADAYSEAAWKAGNYDGIQYTVPLDIHGAVMYWNKDLFRKAGLDPEIPPVNLSEFLEFTKRTTTNKETGFVMSTDFINDFLLVSMLEQNGASLFSKNDRPNFTSDEMKEVLQLEYDLIHTYGITPKNDFDTVGNFLRGTTAIIFDGPWNAPNFEKSDLEWGMAQIPQFFDKKDAIYAKSHQFGMPATVTDPEKKEGVKIFLEYMSTHSDAWANAGQAPAARIVYESDNFKERPQVAMADQFERAVFDKQIDSVGLYNQMLYAQVTEALLGRKSIDEALNQAQKDAMGMYDAENINASQ